MAGNYGQKKPDSYDPNVAGAKRYGPAATGRGPNVGRVSASGKAGYRARDLRNNPLGNKDSARNVRAEAQRNALLRRLQAEQKGAYASRDSLQPPKRGLA